MLDSDLLSPSRILANISIGSKKRLLELISLTMAKKNRDLEARAIYASLCAREQLGSTTLGNGVAIPHGRLNGIDHVEALFIKLRKPLPLDADDGEPVDLVFALVVPANCTEDHSKLLSNIAEKFSDKNLLGQLRAAEGDSELRQLLSSSHL